MFQSDPGHVTLEWVLIMLERRIEQDISMDGTYLVDLIPNLKYVLRSKNFVKDCNVAMEKLEQRVSPPSPSLLFWVFRDGIKSLHGAI